MAACPSGPVRQSWRSQRRDLGVETYKKDVRVKGLLGGTPWTSFFERSWYSFQKCQFYSWESFKQFRHIFALCFLSKFGTWPFSIQGKARPRPRAKANLSNPTRSRRKGPAGRVWDGVILVVWKGLLPGTARKTDRRHRRHICQPIVVFFWFKSCVRRLKKILRRRTRTCHALGGANLLIYEWLEDDQLLVWIWDPGIICINVQHWTPTRENCPVISRCLNSLQEPASKKSKVKIEKGKPTDFFYFQFCLGFLTRLHISEEPCESGQRISDGMGPSMSFPRMFWRDYNDWRKTHQVSVAKAKAKGKAKAKAKAASPVKEAWFSDLDVLSHWVQNPSSIITSFLFGSQHLMLILSDSHFGHWRFVWKWMDEILWRRHQRRAWGNKSRGLQIQMLHWFWILFGSPGMIIFTWWLWWSWQWHIPYISVLLHPLQSGCGRRTSRRGRRGWGGRGWRRGAQQAFWEGKKGYNLIVQLW